MKIQIYLTKTTVSINNKTSNYNINELLLEKFHTNPSPDDLVALGYDIFNNIFVSNRQAIKDKINSLTLDKEIVLSIISDDCDVHDIPFELLNINNTANGFLLKRINISIIREIPSLQKENFNNKNEIIKILFILSMPLETLKESPLDPLFEINRISNALLPYIQNKQIILDIEEKASMSNIQKRLIKQYDIIHFSGHGNSDGCLLIEDENGEDEYLASADDIKTLFHGCEARLFYLDSCLGAKSNTNPSLAYNLYNAFPKANIVANIASISDGFATQSVEEFYKNIFEKSLGLSLKNSQISNHHE